MRQADVIEAMSNLKIASTRCRTAMDDFMIAYIMIQEHSGDPSAMDEAEADLQGLKDRMGAFRV
jgi:hypothetical protein